jgi:hypothetical protein
VAALAGRDQHKATPVARTAAADLAMRLRDGLSFVFIIE